MAIVVVVVLFFLSCSLFYRPPPGCPPWFLPFCTPYAFILQHTQPMYVSSSIFVHGAPGWKPSPPLCFVSLFFGLGPNVPVA